MTLTGRCLCGAVSYTTDAQPLAVTYCHCDDCRRATGSDYNIGVGVPVAELRVTGEVNSFTVTGHGGHSTTREFCPTCGSPMFTRGKERVFINAGSLDNPDALQPTRQIWTEMAVPWSRIPDGLECHAQGGSR